MRVSYNLSPAVLSLIECLGKRLVFMRNIYGDEINVLSCRSLWIDPFTFSVKKCDTLWFEGKEKCKTWKSLAI